MYYIYVISSNSLNVLLISFIRYDYENCDSASANKMMESIETLIQKPEFIGKELVYGDKKYIVKQADNYSYIDPVDGSQAIKQVYSKIALTCLILYFKIIYIFLYGRVYGYCLRMVLA